MKKKIKKVENGNIRIIEVSDFILKMVEKKVISKRDKYFYQKNPYSLCEILNRNEKRFGVKYEVLD